MSIFNSNDYNRGFEDGSRDAAEGKDKDYSRSGMSLKFALYGDKAIDTYDEGYDRGYETEKKSGVYGHDSDDRDD